MEIELSDSLIKDVLSPYGVRVNAAVCSQVRAYISLLLKWNQTISLTTITDPIEILKFHFGESMFAAIAVPIRSGRLADIGSGGGFPGIPLRLAVPALEVTLVETSAKKSAFLSEVVRTLSLTGVEVHRERMEGFIPSAPFDFVTVRALGHFDELLAWASRSLTQRGKIVLWLGDEDSLDIACRPRWTWQERIHIPLSKKRYVLIGSQLP